MHTIDVVRAWKDPEYRASLPEEIQNGLPPHPAGMKELTDEDLEEIAGGKHYTYGQCPPTYQCP